MTPEPSAPFGGETSPRFHRGEPAEVRVLGSNSQIYGAEGDRPPHCGRTGAYHVAPEPSAPFGGETSPGSPGRADLLHAMQALSPPSFAWARLRPDFIGASQLKSECSDQTAKSMELRGSSATLRADGRLPCGARTLRPPSGGETSPRFTGAG